jgi:ATP-dependent helicase/nuclease subunit A
MSALHTAEPNPQPSNAQWEAIRVTDRHLLVSAGAGTGKTFTVVSHILYLLGVEMRGAVHAPPLALADIAAITYTNKAAAELKEKLRSRLRAAGRRDDAFAVDSARVGTIHGFCGDILREFSLRGSLAPGLTLLDDSESRVLRAESVREALLQSLESDTGSPASVEGLTSLLGEQSIADVERWTCELLEQGDDLRAIIADAAARPVRERTLVELARRAEALFVARMRDRGEMDFDRMITWTRDLIRDNEAVRRALQRRIRVLIIDEFQDVDPVQREIAYLLGDAASGRADTTRLVLVGDPKQSIYSFRKANVRGWRTVESDFGEKGLGLVVPIAESRRSVPAVLGFVDHAVGTLLDEPTGDVPALRDFEVPYASVVPTRLDSAAGPAIEIFTVPAKDDECAQSVGVIRASEAQAVAIRACELHDGGVPWREMAVLLSGWRDFEVYEAALKATGVPTYALRSEGFYERREVVDIIIALEAIRTPTDDRALLGFLRSPFVGVTDETLLRLANQLPSPIWPALIAGGELLIPDEKERAFLFTAVSLLRCLSSLRDRTSTASLLGELLDQSAYLAHHVLLGDAGKQAIANVRKFVTLADSSPETSLGGFLEMVESARELAVNEGSARLYGENDDVLTITSIHSAKGLEWDVVFWCDLVRAKRKSSSALLISGTTISLGAGAGDENEGDDAAAPETSEEHKRLAAELDEERDAETKRMWYVAATRAKDRLIVCVPAGSSKKARDAARKRATEGLPPDRAFKCASDAMKRIFSSLGTSTTERYRARDGREYQAAVRMIPLIGAMDGEDGETVVALAALPPLDASLLYPPAIPIDAVAGFARHSATELLSLERCAKRRWFKYGAGMREPALPVSAVAGESNAIARGLIVHEVLEKLREDSELDALLEDAIERHDPDAPPGESAEGARQRASISIELRAVLEQEEYRNVFAADGARRELGFLHIIDAGTHIEGKIDLVAPSPDGYRIVDVKTGKCDADVAAKKAEQYGIQEAVYVRALEEISGMPVAHFGFQFSAIPKEVGESISSDVRARLSQRLDATLGMLTVDPPTLAKSAYECRYCGYHSAGWCAGVPELAVSALESPVSQ